MSALVTIRLYRNLLRTARPFTGSAPNAAVLTSLLHRSGVDDHIRDWNAFVAQNDKNDDDENNQQQHQRARDLTQSYSSTKTAGDITLNSNNNSSNNNRAYQRLFRRLLREVVTGTNGYGKMVFPSQVDTSRLKSVIQREFRASHNNNDGSETTASSHFDADTRQKVAFCALRELHKKLSYYDWLSKNNPEPIPQQAAKRVSPLPIHPPASYLRPGVFLVSHPYMHDSYFSKSVICILEHKGLGSSSKKKNSDDDAKNDDDDDDDDKTTRRNSRQAPPGQTYGVIVNRVSLRTDTGENRTLKEVFREHMLPERLADVFGDSVVREGGPVHVALQMIHSLPADDSVEDVGGSVIPFVSDGEDDDDSPALYSDRATYFQGNMFKTMSRVEKGTMDRDDVSFFVGASIWSPGQLAAEIAQGYWIPCKGPPEMALDGICEHEDDTTTTNRPLADLWLSMMSACGPEEAAMAHLFHNDHWDEHGMPCDDFGDDDDDDNIVVL
eukprot:CAMPEP_0116128848 /NCGR_PEP_ID=MMETSP0329-20121206/7605_1 /TAXON_ID=697910 /ORGANISM="Pseudo-nitzschia arenysensis, Strain B593" /LENGTH=496 /DNA_ID=CAMNT_0003623067 /DNA_START=97 /DNA_END=1586 /DNA_ORIENTATION=-